MLEKSRIVKPILMRLRGDNGEESYKNNTEEAHSSKLKSTISMEDVVVEINVKDKSFYSYADYVVSSDEERIQIVGILMEMMM